MIKLPVLNASTLLNELSNNILTAHLSDDEDIGKFLGLLKVSNDELILLDLIRCIVLTSIKQESLKPMDIDYFCPDGIIIGEDYFEHFISITKAFLNLNDLIGKEDREYVMYIHSLFTFYGLSYHINKYYSEILTDDLVRQGSFWIDFNNIMNGVEQVIQGMEMNYPGDNSDKTPSN